MLMRKILLFFFLIHFSFFSFSQEKKLTFSEIKLLKESVKAKSKKTKTILSDFIQLKHLDFLSNDIETFGKLAYKAPNLVKWEYTKPYTYSVIFKEGKLLINDGGKKNSVNISSSKLFKKLNELIIRSISGDMFDDEEFDISYSKSNREYIVKFNSKNDNLNKYIKQFVIHFTLNSYEVHQIKIIEPTDDYTKIVFKNRKENSILDNAVFSN